MAFYELVTIVRPDVPTNQVETVNQKITDLVTKHEGKVVKTETWGLRTLAYRINKHKKGYYTMLALDMPGAAVAPLEQQMKLNEDIIRFHTIKMDAISQEPSVMMKFKARAFDKGDDAAENTAD